VRGAEALLDEGLVALRDPARDAGVLGAGAQDLEQLAGVALDELSEQLALLGLAQAPELLGKLVGGLAGVEMPSDALGVGFEASKGGLVEGWGCRRHRSCRSSGNARGRRCRGVAVDEVADAVEGVGPLRCGGIGLGAVERATLGLAALLSEGGKVLSRRSAICLGCRSFGSRGLRVGVRTGLNARGAASGPCRFSTQVAPPSFSPPPRLLP